MSITMVMAGEDVCLPTIGALAEELKTAIAPMRPSGWTCPVPPRRT